MKTPVRTVRIEDSLWEAAKTAASREGTTITNVIRVALEQLVNHHKGA